MFSYIVCLFSFDSNYIGLVLNDFFEPALAMHKGSTIIVQEFLN